MDVGKEVEDKLMISDLVTKQIKDRSCQDWTLFGTKKEKLSMRFADWMLVKMGNQKEPDCVGKIKFPGVHVSPFCIGEGS